MSDGVKRAWVQDQRCGNWPLWQRERERAIEREGGREGLAV